MPVENEKKNGSGGCIKGSGGCIGLMDSPETLRRWMLSSPELANLQNQFEYLFCDEEDSKYLLRTS